MEFEHCRGVAQDHLHWEVLEVPADTRESRFVLKSIENIHFLGITYVYETEHGVHYGKSIRAVAENLDVYDLCNG